MRQRASNSFRPTFDPGRRVSRPDADPITPDLDAIETLIRCAIDERRPDLLPTIGNGELSIAIRWTVGAANCVVKRVPPFPSRAAGFPLDSQFANWYWFENEPWQLDFSTPLMVDANGDIRFDSTGFQREYPTVTRKLVYRELMKIAPRYADLEYVLTDVMAQLYRQNIHDWCQPFADAAKRRHGIDLSPTLAKERFESDAKFYPTLLRMKRFQRSWIQRTGRRYDTLLPATTSFGK